MAAAESPPPGAPACAGDSGAFPPHMGGPPAARAPPEDLLPRGTPVSTIQQALSLHPLPLDGSLLVLLPQPREQTAEKEGDNHEPDQTQQDVEAHRILPRGAGA